MKYQKTDYFCAAAAVQNALSALGRTYSQNKLAELINLTDNALKFTEKGFVEISYNIKDSSKEQVVIFYVKDSGIGLTQKQQNNIFNRFTKLESEGEKIYRGAGLGLSICKNIVELLGGKIWIDSEINKGSTFYFSIPHIKDLQSNKNQL